MEKNIQKPSAAPKVTSSPEKKGGSPALQLSKETKEKVWKVISVLGVGALGAVGAATLGFGPFVAGIAGGSLATGYQKRK